MTEAISAAIAKDSAAIGTSRTGVNEGTKGTVLAAIWPCCRFMA